jgi:hypothetical protein
LFVAIDEPHQQIKHVPMHRLVLALQRERQAMRTGAIESQAVPVGKQELASRRVQELRAQLEDERLKELDLLVPRRLKVGRPGQTPRVLQGFCIIDEAKLQALDDSALLTLSGGGQLAWIYTHLMSLRNVAALAELQDKITAPIATPTVDAVATY